jgi:hypothetical protein
VNKILFCILSCLFIFQTASASSIKKYKFEMNLFVDEKKVSNPAIIIGEKKSATIVQEFEFGKSYIDVNVLGMKKNIIKLELKVGKLDHMGKKSEEMVLDLNAKVNQTQKVNFPQNIFNKLFRMEYKVYPDAILKKKSK